MSIYLDHAATTPMVDVAVETMVSQLKELGNPSSLHTHGRAIRKEIEGARELIAGALGALASEVIFTASGTEANNTALKGLFWAGQKNGRNLIVISAIEHHAILDPAQWLVDHEGGELIKIGVDANGVFNLSELTNLIAQRGDEIAVISVMAANNETGVIQPISDIVELAKINSIPVHCDAVQSFGKVPLSFSQLGLSALTISAHKIGGPLGIGVLVLRRTVEIPALLHGGGQEREIRSGTLNAPSILAFAAAINESLETFEVRNFRVEQIRDDFAKRVVEVIPQAYINGVDALRIPGIINVTFPGTESDTLLLLLDAEGISCSTGSACSAGVHRPSHVLLAMGHTEKSAMSSLRFSLGATTTFEEIDETLRVLPSVIERGRMANLR